MAFESDSEIAKEMYKNRIEPEYETVRMHTTEEDRPRKLTLPTEDQQVAIGELHDQIKKLTAMLEPVLLPDFVEKEAPESDEPTKLQSDVARTIDENTRLIYVASHKVRSIISRLEYR